MVAAVRAHVADALRAGRRRFLTLSAAASIALAACGGAKRGSSRAAAPAATKVTPGGKFTQAAKADPPGFDPSSRFVTTAAVLGYPLDRLLGRKTGPDVKYTDFVIEPRLADTYETPDAQTYTFHLHPGVKFADLPPVNGRALAPADVKWTLEFLSRTGAAGGLKPAPSAAMFEGLDRVETPDAATVVARFDAPFAPFLNTITLEYSGILPPEVATMNGGYQTNLVGTGPWQLDTGASAPGQHWVFKKNPTYFRAGLPYIDQITQLIIADDATANAAFEARQLDLLDYTGLTDTLAAQITRATPRAVTFNYLSTEGKHLYLNVAKPPLNDERVRKAFLLCIDRDAMISALADGKGEWAVAGGIPGLFTPQETRQMEPLDPAQAKQLLSAAGYANGIDLTAIYPGQKYGQELIDQWQLIQAQVKKAGINLILQSVDPTDESNRKRTGDFELEMVPKQLEGDLDETIYEVFYSKSAGNYGHIDDPALDQLVLAQRREPDVDKRRQIWRQIAQLAAGKAYATALYYRTQYQLWQPTLKDYYPNQGYRGWPLVASWLDK
jgi:peptide/nickel transport system substrate-binding protein